MSATRKIPAGTIPAGASTLGPFSTGVGFNTVTLDFDIGALVDPCTFTMLYAEDGVNYRVLSTEGPLVAGSAINRDGTPRNPPNIDWSPDLGEVGGVLNLTTAKSTIKIGVDNTTAWTTNGGSLIAS